MILPTGDGIGATHEVWAVMSPIRAAGSMSIKTLVDHREIKNTSGTPEPRYVVETLMVLGGRMIVTLDPTIPPDEFYFKP